VVIDNLHDLAMEEECDDIKEAIISLIEREDIWLILSGRCAVPPWLAAVRYREVFYVIEESELLFDEAQENQYIEYTRTAQGKQKLLFGCSAWLVYYMGCI
jgi:LuxR family maltose regulon positive regulatory protein